MYHWTSAASDDVWAAVKLTELEPDGTRYVNPDAADDWAWLRLNKKARIAYLFGHPSVSATETVNFAQGDLMMLGAFFGLTASAFLGWPYWATILFAIVVMAAVGMLIERIVIRPVLGYPTFTVVMITIGVGYVIRGVVTMVPGWGTETYSLKTPFGDQVIRFGGAVLAVEQLATIGDDRLQFGYVIHLLEDELGVGIRLHHGVRPLPGVAFVHVVERDFVRRDHAVLAAGLGQPGTERAADRPGAARDQGDLSVERKNAACPGHPLVHIAEFILPPYG